MISETEYIDETPDPSRPLTGRAVTNPKRLVDTCQRIDLADRAMQKMGWSRWGESPTSWATLVWDDWGRRSEVVVSKFLDARTLEAALFVDHRWRDGVEVREVEQFAMESTPQRLGFGRRWWIQCGDCDRRVRTLFRPRGERFFKCRECHSLTYRARAWHRKRAWERTLRPLEVRERLLRDVRSRSPRRKARARLRLERSIAADWEPDGAA